jgi:hypothetical protein
LEPHGEPKLLTLEPTPEEATPEAEVMPTNTKANTKGRGELPLLVIPNQQEELVPVTN